MNSFLFKFNWEKNLKGLKEYSNKDKKQKNPKIESWDSRLTSLNHGIVNKNCV